jgi:excinuclease ABC subunit C
MEKGKDKSFSEIPDLIIIDGGKGQLSAAEEIIKPLKVQTKVVGLAKKLEEIFYFKDGEFQKVTLPENSETKFLLQRIRDEAHRFAITYHRNLRSKAIRVSGLDKIEGIGPITKKRLINAFGSLDQIKKASTQELERVVNKKLAEKIKEEL